MNNILIISANMHIVWEYWHGFVVSRWDKDGVMGVNVYQDWDTNSKAEGEAEAEEEDEVMVGY